MNTVRIAADVLQPTIAFSTVAVIGVVNVRILARLSAVGALVGFADAHFPFLDFFGFNAEYALSIMNVQALLPFSMSLMYGGVKPNCLAKARSERPATIRVFLRDSETTIQCVPLPPQYLQSTSLFLTILPPVGFPILNSVTRNAKQPNRIF
jgi:hypothetical protein